MTPNADLGRVMEWCLHRCAYCAELFRPTELVHEGTVLRGGTCPKVCDSGPHETTPILSHNGSSGTP